MKMPIESKTLLHGIAIFIVAVVPLTTGAIFIFERIAVLESHIVELKQTTLELNELKAQFNSLAVTVGHNGKTIAETKTQCTDQDKEFIKDIKSMTKTVYAARKYTRDQLDSFKEQYYQAILLHIADTDLHSEKIEIKKSR